MPKRDSGRLSGFGSQFATYSIGSVLQRGLAFLILPFVTRILGAEEFGEATVAAAAGVVLSYLFTLGLNMTIVRTYFDETTERGPSEWAAQLRLQALAAVALATIAWITGPWWSSAFSEIDWGASLQLAVLYAVPVSIQATSQGVLRAAQRPAAFTSVALSQTILSGALGIWLATVFGAPGYIGGLGLGSLVAATLAFRLTYRPADWQWGSLRAALRLSMPFLIHSLSMWTLALADRVVIENVKGLEAVAMYHVAYVVATAPSFLLDAAQASWAPKYYERIDPEKASLPLALARPATTLGLIVGVATALIAPAVVAILAPASFGYSAAVVGFVSATAAVQASYLVGVAVLLDNKASGWVGIASGVAAVLNVSLNLVLVPSFGLAGAAAATVVAFAVQALIVAVGFRQLLTRPLPIGSLVARWVGAVAIASAAAALPTDVGGWIMRTAGLVVAAVVMVPTVKSLRNGYKQHSSGHGKSAPVVNG